jgi:class 3 adenylate cyclase/tetratricopeptide (TPR) repeat protein
MSCPSCGRASRAGARFCAGCGSSLPPRCAACGAEAEVCAQFCDACGARLDAARPPEEAIARKVVTIVFADLIGSTALHERLDAESARRLMERYYRVLRTPVEANGGRVIQLLGDGVLAAFGVPRVAADDAIRAVRAAVGMQRMFRELAEEQASLFGAVGLRVAVNTGEVVMHADQAEVVGDPVNVAARLQDEAADGDVLIGESTRRLVGELVTLAHLGTFALKGRTERVAAYRVVSLDPPPGAAAIQFVGREDELGRLTAVYDAAVAAPGGRLAVVLGSPGLGKSRLVAEFARRLGDSAAVLVASCDAAGGGATFEPFARALRAFLKVDEGTDADALRAAIDRAVGEHDTERERIAAGVAALLAGTPAPPEETFFAFRRLLRALATTRPVVLAIDDLQWAEPLLLDLVEHLVVWIGGVPLVVIGAARPELRDTRPSLTLRGGLVSDVVTLTGLDASAASRLAANVIGADVLPAAVAGRVLAASEGNPLFVGELVRMLVEDGMLTRDGDRWTVGVDLARLEMPPTIHALLAARIEHLRPDERAVLERAAVVGRRFSRAAVAHLLPREAQADLDARLATLRRSELIEPDASWFLGEPSLRFHHALIRDAAYRRVLKGTRAELHGRVADWIEARVGDAVEHDESIGWHLEQAHQNLRELGPIDAAGRALGERAARHLAAAGRRALARDDVRVAASLLGRALDRLDDADPARADLALDWCEALLAAGDVGPAVGALAELDRHAAGSERLRAWHVCFTGQLAVLTDPKSLRTTAEAVAAAADTLAAAADSAGEAKAHSVHALALQRLGKIGDCEAALDRALAAARRGQDRRRANAVLAGVPVAALWGPSPVTRASGRCLDVVRVLHLTQGAPAVEAVALRCQAVLEALRGRTEAARRMIASARRMVEDLGIAHRLLEADVFAGLIDLLEGDAVTAERRLRGAYEGLLERGLGIDAAQAASYLGHALLAQGRAEEAERLSEEGEALAGDDLQAAIAWRGVRAEALVRRGEHATAVELARAAVGVAAGTDGLLYHANARLILARALRAAGQDAEADAEARRAIELWEAKGATLLAEGARRLRPARTDEVAAEPAAPAAVAHRRRVKANVALANSARLDAAMAARDTEALATVFADDMEIVDHLNGAVYDRRGVLFSLYPLSSARNLTYQSEPLATLGDVLALSRLSASASGVSTERFDVGAYEMHRLALVEVDAHARRRRSELFPCDRLGDAIARLYARYAELLPEGPERMRGTARARTIAALLGPPDPARVATACAPDIEFVDRRPTGFGSVRAIDGLERIVASAHELAVGLADDCQDVLALEPGAFLARWTTSGRHREGGGEFELPHLRLMVLGSSGLFTRIEAFEVDREHEALARFDALTAEPAAANFENRAARAAATMVRRWAERDWDGLVSMFAPSFRMEDRRGLGGVPAGGADVFPNLRTLFETGGSSWRSVLLATRGSRLALVRGRLTDEGDAADPLAFEHLSVVEVDAGGRYVALVVFDLDDVDAAHAELDGRYLIGEGAPQATLLANVEAFRRAAACGDQEALERILPDDFTLLSHLRFGTGARQSRSEYLASLGFMDHLEVRGLRLEHLRVSTTGVIGGSTWYGTRAGGEFQLSVVFLGTHDGTMMHTWELFDREQLEAAVARYEALCRETTVTVRVENAATRAWEQLQVAWSARDWGRFAAFVSAEFRSMDRRTATQLELDRNRSLETFRPIFDAPPSRHPSDALATRGNRLALHRIRWQAGDLAVAPSEVELLALHEVNDTGHLVTQTLLDPGDLDAAYAELDRRYAEGEAAAHPRVSGAMLAFQDAFARRDWRRLAAGFAPELVVVDHRRLGWETLHGAAAYVDALRSLVDLAPDTRLRLDHVRTSARALFWVAAWQGSRDGGPFEAPWIVVSEHDGHGGVVRFDQYDLDQIEAADVRFESLRDGPA